MNIVELLDEVGHTKLTFQYLNDCWKNAKTVGRAKRGVISPTQVTFMTNEIQPYDLMGNPRKVAVIVYMPREDLERALETNRNKGTSNETTTG